jgi:hypothetical protein
MYVAIISYGYCKVDRRMLHMLHMLQVFQRHVASVYLKMFHLFSDVCCNRFNLDVAYVFTHMLQQYVLKYFICFSLLLQQVFSYCKLQVFYPDVTYVFTHMLQCMFQIFYLFQTYVAFKCFMLHVFHPIRRVRGGAAKQADGPHLWSGGAGDIQATRAPRGHT